MCLLKQSVHQPKDIFSITREKHTKQKMWHERFTQKQTMEMNMIYYIAVIHNGFAVQTYAHILHICAYFYSPKCFRSVKQHFSLVISYSYKLLHWKQ